MDNTLEKQAADAGALAITELLSIAANLKAMHVKTGSYAQHMALDTAFEDLNSALDAFNECVQGYYIYKTGSKLPLENAEIKFNLPGDGGVMQAVKKMHDKFKVVSDILVKGVSPLVSMQDDVYNCFYQLFYRLELK